ncbi:MAG: hypothetical protein M1587_09095 [Thaumarchaeota archaeon]|nr:hypothetical protein [Nitrososphaerota archaeon]
MQSERNDKQLKISLLKGIWIYSLIVWVYVVFDMFRFPAYQYLGISMWIPIPENVIADVAFPVSFLCFVAWEYLKRQQN